ncbi:zinc finger protein GLI2-like isoform X2 [Anthonomus grandis grandis]|nr:zinc finger protein GLI2-like isoform X2 [Anthonomus grandis grandis]XP_050306053.1 zinc finger protein GLI2-like isoform X2 [Anthonomus grandis grandis]XP_050306054.1 zinc finger protein GLI2-like isoform X2 [Anthonomus grandis grandis]
MVVGQPIQYYYPYGQSPPSVKTAFPYFHQFENFAASMEPSDDYPMVTSPSNSTQSDSDNSVSSIEIPSHSIEIPKKEERRQCLWINCGTIFQSLTELASHVAQYHSAGASDGLFYCGWEGCNRNNKAFNARYKMLVHVRTHTNEKPHSCGQCNKSFSRAENLKIHSRSHSGEKPYVCPVPGCGKAYSNSSDRFKHTRTHSVEKPYQCKVPGCPKRYTDPSSLRKHVKTYKHYAPEPLANIESFKNVSDSYRMVDDHSRLQENIDFNDKSDANSKLNSGNIKIAQFGESIENHVPVIMVNNARKVNESYHKESPTQQSKDIFGLKAFIDLKADNYGFADTCESKKLYKPYELDSNRLIHAPIAIDAPLDLSIKRNI